MFSVDDYVVYSNSGVCKVIAVGTPEGFEEGTVYYTLKPVTRPETVFIPVESEVYMRRIINREEALALIDRIPFIEEDTAGEGLDQRGLGMHYKNLMSSHNCEDLIMLIKTIRNKSERLAAAGRKLIKTDSDYRQKAESILFNEFALALDIPLEEVTGFIEERLGMTDV